MISERVEKCEAIRLASMEQYGFGPNVMKRTKVCKNCGTIAYAAESICKVCGEKLPKETVFQQYKKRHLYCYRCDTVVPEKTLYCPQCGDKMRSFSKLTALK